MRLQQFTTLFELKVRRGCVVLALILASASTGLFSKCLWGNSSPLRYTITKQTCFRIISMTRLSIYVVLDEGGQLHTAP
ncbi:hypothetical protein LX36DRAFT_313095 [Colletotrichum falcatum]|nr:hypothetical protein LX36DRAFT_313095 [Colletotrichum falcatum]